MIEVDAGHEVVATRQDIVGVEMPDTQAVAAYMHHHPDIAPILPDVVRALREEFPSATRLILDVYADPEIDRTYLALTVRLLEYPEDVLDRIDVAFMAAGDALAHTSGWIVPDTDFVRA